MDIASILGFILGFGLLAVGYAMDGGNVRSLWLPSAMVIVVGGSLGGVFVSYGMRQLRQFPSLMFEIMKKPKSTIQKTIDYLVMLSENSRRSGLLSLESIISEEKPKEKIDPFLKRGILMAVDGTDPEEINEILQNFIYVHEQDKLISISMLDALGAFSPAFGMVGTIIGLIQVLQADMDSPEQLTKAIGVAFITTLYGVLLANLFFLPAATKLKSRLSVYRMEKEMIIEGICAIRNGVNPRLLREKLSSYLQMENTKTNKRRSSTKGEISQ